MRVRQRPLFFADHFEKAAYIQGCGERDSAEPLVIAWAQHLRGRNEWETTAAILGFCQISIDYINDPGVEIIDSAPACIVRGIGDCDAKTILLIALCLASGIPAMVDPVFKDGGRRFPHVRALVFLAGEWRRVDPTIVNSTIGNLPTSGAITNYWGNVE